jgi:hypothetical protein
LKEQEAGAAVKPRKTEIENGQIWNGVLWVKSARRRKYNHRIFQSNDDECHREVNLHFSKHFVGGSL